MNKEINFNQLEALTLSLAQLKYFSNKEDDLSDESINLKPSKSRGMESLSKLLRITATVIQSAENSNNQDKKDDALWLQNALGGYLSQSRTDQAYDSLDVFMGLGGNKGVKGDKAITEASTYLENGFLIRAFYYSGGNNWSDKTKYLNRQIKSIRTEWVYVFAVLNENLKGLSNIGDLFSLIRTSKVGFKISEDYEFIFNLILSSEAASKKSALKKSGIEFKAPTLKELAHQDINADKFPLLIFKHRQTIDCILCDLKLYDSVCSGYENYLTVRKMIELKVNELKKKAAFKHDADSRHDAIINNYLSSKEK